MAEVREQQQKAQPVEMKPKATKRKKSKELKQTKSKEKKLYLAKPCMTQDSQHSPNPRTTKETITLTGRGVQNVWPGEPMDNSTVHEKEIARCQCSVSTTSS